MCVLPACMSVHHVSAEPAEVRNECQIPWNVSCHVGAGNQTLALDVLNKSAPRKA